MKTNYKVTQNKIEFEDVNRRENMSVIDKYIATMDLNKEKPLVLKFEKVSHISEFISLLVYYRNKYKFISAEVVDKTNIEEINKKSAEVNISVKFV